MEEIWKNVVGYERIYEISNLGNIKSIARIVRIGRYGKTTKGGIILKKITTKIGYHRILLGGKNIKKQFFIHRLVATAFIPNPENKPQVNHINGIKTDNRVENLEWCNSSENQIHAYKNGLQKPTNGVSNGQAKLTEKDVLEIRASSLTPTEISKLYKVNLPAIYKILSRIRWKHI